MFVDVLKTSTRGPGWMFRCWIHSADFIRRIKVVVDWPTLDRCDLMLIQLLTQCVSMCVKPACCTGDDDGNDWGRRWSVWITSLWANNNSKVVTVIFGGRYCNITVIMCVICYTACHWGQKYQHCTVIPWTRYCWTLNMLASSPLRRHYCPCPGRIWSSQKYSSFDSLYSYPGVIGRNRE